MVLLGTEVLVGFFTEFSDICECSLKIYYLVSSDFIIFYSYNRKKYLIKSVKASDRSHTLTNLSASSQSYFYLASNQLV